MGRNQICQRMKKPRFFRGLRQIAKNCNLS
jgi:hypothetical protein